MINSPLITIITVSYNAEETIRKTLLSIKNQTFSDFEHLIIDGASKDSTLEIVNQNSMPQTLVVSEPDKGLYDAMNKALTRARGEYVLFLNAGDAFHRPDSLEEYARYAKQGYDIIYGDTDIVDKVGNYISKRHLNVPEELNFKSFSKGMLICHQAFMVKKSLASPYNLKYRFSSDYDWCINCIKNSDPKKNLNLKKVTIDYLSDGLTDKNKIKSLKERFKIMSHHYGFFPTLFNHIGFIFRALKRGSL